MRALDTTGKATSWQAGGVATKRAGAPPEDSTQLAPEDLVELVGQWRTVPDIAEQLGWPLSRVRQLLSDREVLGLRVGPRNVLQVPARFLDDHGPRKHLRGTFTVLADGGMGDAEAVRWLFTVDDSLPVPGAPIDALLAGHVTEVRRRAQLLAW